MKLDKLNSWLTLLANLGVILGIIFLALEVRQNEETLRLQYELALLDSNSLEVSRFSELRRLWLQNPELLKIYQDGMAGRELNELDRATFMTMCSEEVWAYALMYERAVVLDRPIFRDSTIKVTRRELEENPGLRDCWKTRSEMVRTWGYDEYVDAVEQANSP